MAYKLLSGQKVDPSAGAGRPNTVLLDPQILDNTTDQGKADLQKWIVGPGHGPALAAQPVDPELDRLRSQQGPVVLQGRIAPLRDPLGDAGNAGVPHALHLHQGPMTATDHRPAARGDRRLQDVRRRGRPRPTRPCRSGPAKSTR